MLIDLIGKTMEVYIDDILVKSLKIKDHIKPSWATFYILRRYRIRINFLKFLGYMVN